ncbi:MAG: hypothetical protein Q9M36_00210 [Sulfurovum sp.]|nr:hypothetical protein [Sulfurovum sp.]
MSSQDKLEITLIHEGLHFRYEGLLGATGKGRHNPAYYDRVGRDWFIYKGGQSYLF